MYAPKININGTSGVDLLEQYRNAAEAIQSAFRIVQECAPHGRDFQTVEPERYRLARQQHNRWLSQLDDIHKQIEAVAIEILDQLPAPK